VRPVASDRAAAVFFALAGIPPEDRRSLLAAQCAGDDSLKEQVERLLEGLDDSGDFLDPAALHCPEPTEALQFPPGTRIGGFTVLRVIGAGASGIVYVARQEQPSRTVQ